jgi:hypothetical protein
VLDQDHTHELLKSGQISLWQIFCSFFRGILGWLCFLSACGKRQNRGDKDGNHLVTHAAFSLREARRRATASLSLREQHCKVRK